MPDIFGGAELKTRPASCTIKGRSPEEIFAFLRDPSQWPRFFKNLYRIEKLPSGNLRWVVVSKTGAETSWETEFVAERKNELLAWKSSAGSQFELAGAFTLEPAVGKNGTIVSLKMAYNTTLGKIVGVTEKLVGLAGKFEEGGDPDTEAAINVRRLKCLIETGEVPTIEGQPNGRDEGEQDESAMLAG
jgi:uncharacterized membrane protein